MERKAVMMSILKSKAYPGAYAIAETLKKAGYTVFFAGGCVRDSLLKREVKEIDIASSAPPEIIQKLFKKTINVGAQFGVVVVLKNGFSYEVATFRKDGNYLDGRHPTTVSFTDAEEDAKRRDFTINGLFYDPFENKIIDYVNGINDIQNKVIRAIGNPYQRFTEDKLRMLRAIRFSAQLGFTIEKQTQKAIQEMASQIQVVSRERIKEEIAKILENDPIQPYLSLIYQLNLWENVFGFEYIPNNILLAEKCGKEVGFEIRFYSLFWQNPYKEKIFENFRLSNKQIAILKELDHLIPLFPRWMELRKAELKRIFKNPYFLKYLVFFTFWQEIFYPEQKKIVDFIKTVYNEEKNRLHYPILVNGEDLKQLGLKPGPIFKKLLEEVENLQMEECIKSREEALQWIKKEIHK